MREGPTQDFSEDALGTLRFRGRICVPEQEDLRKKILAEAHESTYSIHQGGTKMYKDLRQIFWWDGMKRDIAYFVACCDICNKVKANSKNPPDFSNLYPSRNGNGMMSAWILSPVYPGLTEPMM